MIVQESEGCGGKKELVEGTNAIARLGAFFKNDERCELACTDTGGSVCIGVAPVRWHFGHNTLPAAVAGNC